MEFKYAALSCLTYTEYGQQFVQLSRVHLHEKVIEEIPNSCPVYRTRNAVRHTVYISTVSALSTIRHHLYNKGGRTFRIQNGKRKREKALTHNCLASKEMRLVHHRVEIAVVKLNNVGIFRSRTINLCTIVSLLLLLHRPTQLRDEGFEINTLGRRNTRKERKNIMNK